jgi:hypothetical protein
VKGAGFVLIYAGLILWAGRSWYLWRQRRGAPRWPWTDDGAVFKHNAKGEHWREAE